MLRVHSDGSLNLVPGGVVSSHGTLPDSLAVHGDLVYVANSGAGHSNYTGFRFFRGHLFRIPGSTVTLASDAAPGDVLFDSTGTKLAGTEVGPSLIDSFTVGSGGRLTAAPGSPFPAQGLGPFGSEFRPASPDQLFVSNAHNTAKDSGTVSAFKDHRNGYLSPIGGSPFPDHQMAPCWVEITHDGQFLFTVNTASGTISAYQIAANGALTLLPASTPAGGPDAGAVDARLSPDGGFLYVDQAKAHAVAAFGVNGGSLTQLGTSPPRSRCPPAPRPQASSSANSLARQAGAQARPTGSVRRPAGEAEPSWGRVLASTVKLAVLRQLRAAGRGGGARAVPSPGIPVGAGASPPSSWPWRAPQ